VSKKDNRRRPRGLPWPRKLVNGTVRWYLPKGETGGRLVPLRRQDGTFVDGLENRKEAVAVWRNLPKQARPRASASLTVAGLIDLYLDASAARVEADTLARDSYEFYASVLVPFAEAHHGLPPADLTPDHVDAWWRQHPTWAESTCAGVFRALQTALNWAASPRKKLIEYNPLRGMPGPTFASRGATAVISPEDHQRLLGIAPQHLRDVLTAFWHTGCRPSVICAVTADDFHPEAGTWRLEKHKTRRKAKGPLVVHLTPPAVELSARLARRYSTGPLFRTRRGAAWTSDNLKSTIAYWARRAGLTGIFPYGYRHTLATGLLLGGVPETDVAAVLGHANTAMLHKHYSHVGSRTQHLREALSRRADAPPAGA
jgi:integrase